VMTVGRAVIVGDQVGCAPDLVRQGENGFAIPAGDVAALAEAMRRIVTEPGRAQAMGAASRAIIDGWSFREDVQGLRQALRAVVGECS
jgi:glycosyltransferase involved in cell wall biosynthesis